jgi:hypothetical protein
LFSATTSPLTTPTNTPPLVMRVAAAVPSYTLLAAVIPVTVKPTAEMLALALGCVSA